MYFADGKWNKSDAEKIIDFRSALSESQKHLADANRGAQRQAEVNQLLVKELVQVKEAFSEKEKAYERLREELKTIHELTQHNIPYYGYGDNQAACDMAYRLSKIAKLAM